MNNGIYLDYAATTPTDGAVLAAALPYFGNVFYNPSSTHAAGQAASAAVERARGLCAQAVCADPNEIYFTSGGTEAINWAMRCSLDGKKHVVVSAIEHDAVSACARMLKAEGVIVDRVKPNSEGMITPGALDRVMRDDTALVCVMTVNNIVGSIQPIKELAAVAHRHGASFFTDAVQAVNSVDLNVRDTDVDMLAVSGHKFYAPKGGGFLYVKRGVRLSAGTVGGNQERGLRAGTVNVPAVVAMGEAISAAQAGVAGYCESVGAVSSLFLQTLRYGRPIRCQAKTPDIVSVVFDGINGGRLAVALSCVGVYCSVGSACSAGSATPPETLVEMGVDHPDCSVRFSFGKTTDARQAVIAAQTVNTVVERFLRDKA